METVNAIAGGPVEHLIIKVRNGMDIVMQEKGEKNERKCKRNNKRRTCCGE